MSRPTKFFRGKPRLTRAEQSVQNRAEWVTRRQAANELPAPVALDVTQSLADETSALIERLGLDEAEEAPGKRRVDRAIAFWLAQRLLVHRLGKVTIADAIGLALIGRALEGNVEAIKLLAERTGGLAKRAEGDVEGVVRVEVVHVTQDGLGGGTRVALELPASVGVAAG
jgi:hypothetical protein